MLNSCNRSATTAAFASFLPGFCRAVFVAVCAVVVAVATECRAEPPVGYRVLSVGIGKYKDPGVGAELKGAVNDANRIAEVFRSQPRPAHVKLLLNEDATADAVCDALEDLPKQTLPGELVVVYLSGHGSRRGTEWSFVAYDFEPNHSDKRPADADWVGRARSANHAIPGSLIYRYLRRLCMQGHNVLLAVDACFAGQMAEWAAISQLGVKEEIVDLDQSSGDVPIDRQGGLIVLASSIPSQTSLDGPDNSLFTKGFLEALQGGADWNGNGEVTLKEVKHFLSWRVKELTYRERKLPGMSWPEQCCLCQSSYAVAESMTLALSSKGKPEPVYPAASRNWPKRNSSESHAGRLQEPVPEASLTGLWRIVTPVIGPNGAPLVEKDGKPRLAIYALQLQDDGTYIALHLDANGNQRTTPGRYRYHLSYAGRVFDEVPRTDSTLDEMIHDHDFYLEYENGYDRLKLESVTDNSMRITVYPNPSLDPGSAGTYELERVEQETPKP